jgi:hypothetical protein
MKTVISHYSHGMGDAIKGRPGSGITRMAPKKLHQIEVAHGMQTKAASGATAYGADHRSGLDSVSGATVVPGVVKAQPGYGNAGLQSGHPFARPPGSKNVRAVPVHPSQSKGAEHDQQLADLGGAILAQAVRN